VARNVFYLYMIQGLDYLFPLITVPYLVRVLGPERYGTLGFGAGFIAFVALLVDYGFVLSATRRVSVQRDDLLAVSRTASSVWAAKILLGALGFVAVIAALRAVPRLGEVAGVVLLLYGRIVGGVLSPVWLFQGMEKMRVITLIGLLNSLLVAIGLFAFIRRPSDYLLFAGIQGASAALSGVLAAALAISMFRLRLPLPTVRDVAHALREGFPLFFSTSCVSLYTAANSVILGLLTNDAAVGYYVAAEKIVGAVRSLMSPVSQAIYPRLSRLAAASRERALYWSRTLLLVMGGGGAILSAGLLVAAPLITRVLLGSRFEPAIPVVRILAPLAVLVGLSNVFGIQMMLPFGRDRAFTAILFSAGVINVGLALALAPRWQASGMAAAVLVSELFVTVAMAAYLVASRLNPFRGALHAAQPE
jgi:PST family polysaccharide transporter